MKRLLAFTLLLGCLLCCAKADMPATPTDLEVVEQVAEPTPEPTATPMAEPTPTPTPTPEPTSTPESTSTPALEPEPERYVEITYEDRVYHYGEEVTLIAVLFNYHPTDICTYYWEYSLDCMTWNTVAVTEEPYYTFLLDYETCNYWWHVIVHWEE